MDYSVWNKFWGSSQFSSSSPHTKRLLIPFLMSLLRKSWHWYEKEACLKSRLSQNWVRTCDSDFKNDKPRKTLHLNTFISLTQKYPLRQYKKQWPGMVYFFYTESESLGWQILVGISHCIWHSIFISSGSQFLSMKTMYIFPLSGALTALWKPAGSWAHWEQKWYFKFCCWLYFIPSSHIKTYNDRKI